MKKIYSFFIIPLLLIGSISFAQTFSYTKIDTAKYGPAGDELICFSRIVNSTLDTISMRVTREQNVMGDAPTWTSAFCTYLCYFPTKDSVTERFLPMDTINFSFHFYTTSTPGHATGKMKFRNMDDLSNTFSVAFFGSTDGTQAGVNNLSGNSASVSIYPMPIVSGNVFSLNVVSAKPENKISLVFYNIFGSAVAASNVITGINLMSLDLPAGVYSYSLLSEGIPLNSGKLVVSK